MIEGVILFLFLTSPLWIFIITKHQKYKKSTYRKETMNSYWKVIRDKGLLGEYFTTQRLDKVNGYHKFLVNCYVPNGKGGTSETDIIFLHETGIYVIESVNGQGKISISGHAKISSKK
ncbi:nuclease-related domain-containing protein [Aneurinibacillus tyrosinisolvens]|uniref:nuclease-related domain-containing protein n=1 Tax=Aneurinibacillus tyrosinisolvens TaxID=1443435 RepID=UPI000699977E|nr:nuclease-related domain-containing protein [Aneurinibacillus tyrosinisolvens]